MALLLNLSFTSVSELRRWLQKKMWDFDGPDEFYSWLYDFFDKGNTITVHGEEYDYWACWELT